jgi:hypothetical protein
LPPTGRTRCLPLAAPAVHPPVAEREKRRTEKIRLDFENFIVLRGIKM